jgi:hypothetical protein
MEMTRNVSIMKPRGFALAHNPYTISTEHPTNTQSNQKSLEAIIKPYATKSDLMIDIEKEVALTANNNAVSQNQLVQYVMDQHLGVS